MTEPAQTRPLSTPLKTLAILDEFARSSREVAIGDIARQMNVSRSYAYQQIVTLIAAGWVEKSPSGAYRLTLRANQIAQAALEQAGIDQRALPMMEELAHELEEAVSLAVLDNGTALIAQRVEVGQPLRADLKVGTRMPMHLSSSGSILAAYMSEAERARLREEGVELLPEEDLSEIRRVGYAFSSGRWLEGIHSIAAPIFGISGRCIAALSVVGPKTRFQPAQAKDSLLACAEKINRLCGPSSYVESDET